MIMMKCEHDLIQTFDLINFSQWEIKGYEKANLWLPGLKFITYHALSLQ